MKLHAKQSFRRPALRVVIHHGAHHMPVQDLKDHVPAGDDMRLIPIADFDVSLQRLGIPQRSDQFGFAAFGHARQLAPQGQESAPSLFIHLTGVGVGCVDVGLVALQDPLPDLRQGRAAKLDPAVRTVDPIFQFQLEILCRAAPPDQERIRLDRPFGGAFADDGPVFHSPERGIAIPIVQGLAVKNRLEPGGLPRLSNNR